ncbi:MAG TPA: 1,4-dihydroxy-2-naphthoate polyprenyltransferase [Acidimicrobiales bacterium]|nr:1,4-dihydroxy-2-naphthoate polyprenyltransferase [Acidimicrobiales bacterium]
MTARLWLDGARPRTLPAAVVPVAVGTAVASSQGDVVWWRAGAALVVALAVQVGTNYANDYSDGIRGTDDQRAGPVRLVGSGLKTAGAVKRAALVSFAVGGLAGLALCAAVTWWLALVGAACLLAGWFYTGGSRPYGYAALGEVSVFVFFGVVATVGSAYVHLEKVTKLAVGASIPVGALATALLVVNNLRDIPTDTAAGKRTLAVRLGDPDTRSLYLVLLLAVPAGAALLLAVVRLWALVALLGLVAAVPPARAVRRGARGRDLVPVLRRTGEVQLLYGVLLAAGVALG